MRGKATLYIDQPAIFRITPAYAGKSLFTPFTKSRRKDHPRLCGEKQLKFSVKVHNLGSPPPMRGKVPRSSVILDCVRITPAYAGKRQDFAMHV